MSADELADAPQPPTPRTPQDIDALVIERQATAAAFIDRLASALNTPASRHTRYDLSRLLSRL